MSMCIFFFFNYVQNSREKETATARCGLSLNYAEAIFTSLPLSNFTHPALRFFVIIIIIFFVLFLNFLDSIPFALTFVLFRTFPTLFHFVFHLH